MKKLWHYGLIPLLCVPFVMGGFLIAQQPQQVAPSEQNTLPIPAEALRDVESGAMSAWLIEALQAARSYVEMLDRGQYSESWNYGAKLFQRTITQAEWTKALELARKRLGGVRSRTLKDERPAYNPRGMPAGVYMVVEFNTSFDRAPNSGELLTLMRDSDGQWHVLTYQVN